MQANIEMTEGRKRLRDLIDAFPPDSAHWNEAQNRFQFVDRLLLECLGWEHPLIDVEHFDEGGGRADYVLGKPIKAVLEAKREAKQFSLLPTARPTAIRKLRPLVDACANLRSACSQVVSYCALHGAQIAVVCNGPQLVVFQAIIPGQSPLDGECYVFDGFKSYIDHFPLLWSLLSPEGVFENRAYREMSLHRNPRIPIKAATAIPEPNAYRYRTPFQENLRNLATVLLDNIEEHSEIKSSFYKECYVPLEANNRHLLLSKNIISARYRRVSDNGIAPAVLSTTVQGGKLHLDEETSAGIASSRPVVVIGDVGVGKTSFFENLYQQIDSADKGTTLYIYINLGEKATLSADVKTHILSAVPTILRNNYGIDIFAADFVEKVYSADLKYFDNSVQAKVRQYDEQEYQRKRIAFLESKVAQADTHLQAALEYMAKSGKQIMMVIDNADQRMFEIQQEAFLVAQELASTRRLLVFVALRPSTFYQSKLTGALSGYQNRVLTISPPPADEVIRRRIAFALRVAEGQIAPAALQGISLNLTNIATFLRTTLRSIKDNQQIRSFLSNITGGNTRMVIELITGFCGSPNVESERIVKIEDETGDYKVPLHEFAKHALLGEYAHYNPTSSLVACNIFDVLAADPREHFLATLLIAYLSTGLGIKDNDGYVSGSNLIAEGARLGFLDEQVRNALVRLATKRLIETPHGQYREVQVGADQRPDGFHFRATSIGIYHIRYWAGTFSFLDAVCIDTPIFDEAVRGVVFSHAADFDIRLRFERTNAFKSYLEARWHDADFGVNYYDFPGVLQSQADSFSAVERVVVAGGKNRNRKRR